LSEKIEGYVIEGEKNSFLDGGNRWREIPVREAHVHPASAIEEIREAFHYCRNKPRRMYQALRLDGVTFVTGTSISFYVVSGGNQPFVGDCAQLTTETKGVNSREALRLNARLLFYREINPTTTMIARKKIKVNSAVSSAMRRGIFLLA